MQRHPQAAPPPTDAGSSAALAEASWQDAVTAPVPRRADLLDVTSCRPRAHRRISFHRNVPVELVVRAWQPFAAYSGLDLEVELGPYDDSLSSVVDGTSDVDLHVVFLDPARYGDHLSPAALADWLVERVASSALSSTAPVLVLNWAEEGPRADGFNETLATRTASLPGVEVGDLRQVRRELPVAWTDDRMTAATGGTGWSDAAVLSTARALAVRWIPALVLPPVKAVVVDLDGTLYDGVLGEDGLDGVVLTPEHARLQEDLRGLGEAGVLLALCSRNDPADVAAMFAGRTDFPLRPEHFSQQRVSWGSKVDALESIATALRIAPDSLVLLDDNVGELAQVGAALPEVRTVHARGATSSRRALEHCPGLFRFRRTPEDVLRTADLAAAQRRDALRNQARDRQEYQRQLDLHLHFAVDDPASLDRLAELTQKTNQFNTSLERRTAGALEHAQREDGLRVVAVSLRDRLSDSGTVAVVLARQEEDRLVIEGVCISCRALGRDVEDVLVRQALLLLAGDGTREVEFRFIRGDRNEPALSWLRSFAGQLDEGRNGRAVVSWDPGGTLSRVRSAPVTIVVEEEVA